VKSRRWRRVGALAVGVIAAVLLPTAAQADTPLPTHTVVSASGTNSYTFSTSTLYWSIVAIQPASGDVDLRLANATTAEQLGTSVLGTGTTDFVAVNSNAGARPFGGYRATTSPFSGSPAFWIEQIQGNSIITLPTPANDGVSGPSDPDITFAALFEADVVSISDIYLTAGQKFWASSATAGNYLFLLESNPADSTTFVRSRSAANANTTHSTVDGCTLYTAKYTGWHALALIGDVPPIIPGSGGVAHALHQWNPAKPNTCPVKNFPDATPA
jgi:hypothetical protein